MAMVQVENVGNAPPPSQMCTLGQDLLFLGSWGGDSLLVQASPDQPQVRSLHVRRLYCCDGSWVHLVKLQQTVVAHACAAWTQISSRMHRTYDSVHGIPVASRP